LALGLGKISDKVHTDMRQMAYLNSMWLEQPRCRQRRRLDALTSSTR
jgi:hypothetical protein